MENDLMVIKNTIPSEHEIMVYHTMAEQAVSSKMYKGIGDKSGIMMIMLASRELGIPPMQALNGGLNIIQGKVEISARMMNALIRRSGHQIKIKETSDSRCILEGRRCDTGEVETSSYTVAEAQRAGLVKQGGGWTKYPRDMCFARALSRLARLLFSDVIGIGYVESEISQTHEIKNSGIQEIIEEQNVDNQEVKVNKTKEDFLRYFDDENKFLAYDYLDVVKNHFGWSLEETIEKLLEDEKKLFEKFNSWKLKNKPVEEK